MITELTKEDIERIEIVREKWLKIGLSTKEDRYTHEEKEHIKNLVTKVYENVGLKKPEMFIWLDSPMAGCVGAHILSHVKDQVEAKVWSRVRSQVEDQLGDHVMAYVRFQVGSHVGAQVGDQVRSQVRYQVMDYIGAKVRSQVMDQVGDYVKAQVGVNVWSQVRSQVMDQVEAHVRDKVGGQLYKCGYGIHDAGWLSFYCYFEDKLKCIEKLGPIINISQIVGWWWPFENAVIITPPPCILIRDDNNRIHSENGPCISYLDGYSIYAWHGVRVDKDIIEHPENIKLENIIKENNQEIRRVMLERYGYDRFLKEMKATIEHTDEYGELVSTTRLGEYLDGEDLIAKFVVVKDPSTDRVYALRVHPDTKTAKEGVAQTFEEDELEYNPIKQT